MSQLSLQQFGFQEADSYEDLCVHIGEMLHLAGPVDSAVAKRAVEDGRYAFYLTMSSNNPKLLEQLLNHPLNQAFDSKNEPSGAALMERTSTRTAAKPADRQTSRKLVKQAAQAMLRWSSAGFRQTPSEELTLRWRACQACSHLIEAPKKTLYKVASFKVPDTRICSLCGCVAYRKAIVSTETCPSPDPNKPYTTRWGQALKPARGAKR